MQKVVGKGTVGDYGGMDIGCLGHCTGRRGNLLGLGNALGTGGRDVHPLALVVLHGAAQVPTIDTVGSPRVLLV